MEQMGAFLPLILIFGVFYILLILPQQKKVKQHREMINNLRRGDKIITTGGIIGSISKVNDNMELLVEISENIEIKIAPGMVSDLYVSSDTVKQNTSAKTDTVKQNKSGMLSGFFGKKEK
jgi:preprotein translocase subunit YajC